MKRQSILTPKSAIGDPEPSAAGMVERVARVITERANPDHEGRIEGEYAVRLARYVIAAMREPTHAMFVAAPPTHGKDTAGQRIELLHGGPGDTWRAMIDTALAEDTA